MRAQQSLTSIVHALFLVILFHFIGRIEEGRAAGEDRLAEGEGFLGFVGSLFAPVGPALITLGFRGFLLRNCHGIARILKIDNLSRLHRWVGDCIEGDGL